MIPKRTDDGRGYVLGPLTVVPLDDPYTDGGLGITHWDIEIDGERWQRGDVFYLADCHLVPRPFTFQYFNAANGNVVCFSRQRHRTKTGTRIAGFIDLVPTRSLDPDLTGPELTFRQLLADLIDLGAEGAADRLAKAWEATPDTPGREELIIKVQSAIEHAEALAVDPDDNEELEFVDIDTDLV